MSEEFGSGSGDPTTPQEHSFNRDGGDNPPAPSNAGITEAELEELRKRDENAQAHIPRLEGENEDLRNKVAEMESKLASNSVLEEVMNRLDGKTVGSDAPATIDPDKLAQDVENRLQRKAQEQIEEANWNSVVSKLEAQYGEWANVDKEITARCAELDMDPADATQLARKSPVAFQRMFEVKEGDPAQVSSASFSNTQTSVIGSSTDDKSELRKYYKDMRRDNYAKWQKLSTQRQMWKDLYDADL
jgi:DNA repair ATPase RecN